MVTIPTAKTTRHLTQTNTSVNPTVTASTLFSPLEKNTPNEHFQPPMAPFSISVNALCNRQLVFRSAVTAALPNPVAVGPAVSFCIVTGLVTCSPFGFRNLCFARRPQSPHRFPWNEESHGFIILHIVCPYTLPSKPIFMILDISVCGHAKMCALLDS